MTPPPINIDGTNENYSNVTIDGQDVTQITIDGQDVLSATAENTIARYNAQLGFSAGDESTSVSSWPDETGSYDISTNGGDALVTGSGINGNRSLDLRGDNVEFQLTSKTLTQPFSIIAVVEYKLSDTSNFAVPFDRGDTNGGSDRTQLSQGLGSGNNSFKAKLSGSSSGLDINQTASDTPIIFSARFDGSNSRGRVAADGASSVNTATGTLNSTDLVGWSLGSGDGTGYYEGYVGEYLIFDAGLSNSEFAEEESRIAAEWGFSGGWI